MIHRQDTFHASKILARVIKHLSITVRWNTVLVEVLGKVVSDDKSQEEDDDDGQDLDLDAPVTKGVSCAVQVWNQK